MQRRAHVYVNGKGKISHLLWPSKPLGDLGSESSMTAKPAGNGLTMYAWQEQYCQAGKQVLHAPTLSMSTQPQ